MSKRLLENAKKIAIDTKQYSDIEVFRAIRFLAQHGETSTLDVIIRFPSLSKEEYVLEAIKESRKLKTIDFFEYIFTWASTIGYTKEHISEAIDVAIHHDREDLLLMVLESPEKFSTENRDKVSKYLYEGKKSIKIKNEQPEFRGINQNALRKLIEKQKEDKLSKKMKILISYKTVDKCFTHKVADYLDTYHKHEFGVLYDEFIILPGDSLGEEINQMLENYDRAIMIWTPNYFEERGWANLEQKSILQQRVSDGKRFVPILLKGDRKMLPATFRDWVPADFREYEKTQSQQVFDKKMKDVVKGLKK